MTRREGSYEVHASVSRPPWSRNRCPKPRHPDLEKMIWNLEDEEHRKIMKRTPRRSEIRFDHLGVDVSRSIKPILRSKVVDIWVKLHEIATDTTISMYIWNREDEIWGSRFQTSVSAPWGSWDADMHLIWTVSTSHIPNFLGNNFMTCMKNHRRPI